MKKRIISIILSIVMLVSLLPTTVLAAAQSEFVLSEPATISQNASAEDDYVYIKSLWHVDDDVDGATNNSNIKNSYIKLQYSGLVVSGTTLTPELNGSLNFNEVKLVGDEVRCFLLPATLEKLNAEAYVFVKIPAAITPSILTGGLVSEIGSGRSYGLSGTFYVSDTHYNQNGASLGKLKLGQKKDGYKFSGILEWGGKEFLSRYSISSAAAQVNEADTHLPTAGNTAEIKLSATAMTDLGTDAGAFQTPATITRAEVLVNGAAAEGVSVSTEGSSVVVTLSEDVYNSIGSAASAEVQVRLFVTMPGRTDGVWTNTVTTTLAEPPAANSVDIYLNNDPVTSEQSLTLPGKGQANNQRQYTVKVLDQYGHEMTGQTIEWSITGTNTTGISVNNGTLTVTEDASEGNYTLTATCDEAFDNVTIKVEKAESVATSIKIFKGENEVTADTIYIPEQYRNTVNYTAIVYDQYGEVMFADDAKITRTHTNKTIDNLTIASTEVESNRSWDYFVDASTGKAGSFDLVLTSGNASASVHITFAYLEPQTITCANVTGTYGQTEELKLNPSGKQTAGAYRFAIKSGASTDVVEVAADGKLTIKNAGETTIVVKAPGDATHASASVEVKVTVDKADITEYTDPTANDLTYNGSAQALITEGSATGGSMMYAIGTAEQATGEWSTNVPTGTDIGTYTVYYKVIGDANHNGTDVLGPVQVTISKAKAEITVDQTPIVKTFGEAIVLPTATSTFGEVVCDKTAADLVNVGTYTVTYTVAGTDNYDGDAKTVSVTINKLAVNEPSVTGTYTYTGEEQTATVTGKAAYMTESGAVKGTNAGDYTITYTLDGNHCWADGSDGTVTWVIGKAALTATASSHTVTYGTAAPTYTVSYTGWVKGEETPTTAAALTSEYTTTSNVGEYAVTFETAPVFANYTVTTENGKVTVERAKTAVEPTAATGLVYTGKAQNGYTDAGTHVTLGGTSSATDAADSYSFTATPEANYAWSDGSTGAKTYNWSITKAEAEITVDETPIVKTFGEAIVLPTATSNFGEVVCDKTAADLVNVGTYTVTYTVAGTSNYDVDAKTVSVTINQLAVNEPSVTGTYTYTGEEQTATVTGKEAYMTETGAVKGTNAGDYTITYTLDGNHCWADGSDGTVTWSIGKAALTATASSHTVTYGTAAPTYTVSYTGWVKGEETPTTAAALTSDYTTTSNVGEYAVTFETAPVFANYTVTTENGKVTVERTKTAVEPTAADGLVYTGKAQNGYTNAGTHVTLGGTSSATDAADSYSFTATPDANYAWSDGSTGAKTYNWSIAKAKAEITVDETPIVKTFGEAIVLPTATSSFGEVVCDKTAAALVDVGTYTVTYTVAGTSNYDGDTKTVSVTINQLAVNEPSVTGTYTYTGEEQTATVTGKAAYMTESGAVKGTNAGDYTITYTLDGNHCWADGSDGTVTWSIGKATPYIKTTPAPNDIEYGKKLSDSTLFGGYVQVSSTDSTQIGGLFEWTNPDTVPGIDDSEITEYDVTFTPADTNNYNTVSCKITIKVTHIHNLIKVTGQAATETAAGFKDYYECMDSDDACHEYFEDATGLISIENLDAWKSSTGNGYLAPLVHTVTSVNGQDATDTEAGYKAYYECKNCGKFYEDATGLVEIPDINAWKAEGGDGYLAPLHGTDDNHDHICDYCDRQVSECVDADNDHKCDICGKQLSECKDENKDHICDYCGGQVSEHKGVLVKGTAPMIKRAGFKDYYECEICGKLFEDADCKVEITDLEKWKAEGGNGYIAPLEPESYTVTFNMNGHGTQVPSQTVEKGKVVTKPTDPQADGWLFNGWYLTETASDKSYDFSLPVESNLTLYAVWTSNLISYKIIQGADQIVLTNANQAVFASNADFSKFKCVKVDGMEVAKKYYTAASGSTVTAFNKKFVSNKLKVGTHSIEIVSTDGSAKANFTVADPLPKTGDTSAPFLWLGMCMMAIFSILMLRKKAYRD